MLPHALSTNLGSNSPRSIQPPISLPEVAALVFGDCPPHLEKGSHLEKGNPNETLAWKQFLDCEHNLANQEAPYHDPVIYPTISYDSPRGNWLLQRDVHLIIGILLVGSEPCSRDTACATDQPAAVQRWPALCTPKRVQNTGSAHRRALDQTVCTTTNASTRRGRDSNPVELVQKHFGSGTGLPG